MDKKMRIMDEFCAESQSSEPWVRSGCSCISEVPVPYLRLPEAGMAERCLVELRCKAIC